MQWIWEVGEHQVCADMNAWTGKRSVTVDGTPMTRTRGGLRARFTGQIDGQPAEVDIGLRYAVSPTAELTVSGRSVPAVSGPLPTPWWVWPFVIACVAILFVARGGAIPGALAGAGAASCYYVSIAGPHSWATRLLLCIAITTACWGGFYALLGALT